ncbi:AMP-binding protein [Sporosarcina soli]|uniref:AMP-binding protein n=1 Tax=Sporosarcina soli TaxID=334736 RepID=A0ABW0TEV6_9BACL
MINPKEDVAVLQYTGGTTGKPKGAMITHFNFVSYAHHYRLFYSLQQKGEIILVTSPLFHASGLLMLNLTALTAATYIVVERFNVDTVFEIIRSYRPTLFPGVPTMFIGLINNASALLRPDFELSLLNSLLSKSVTSAGGLGQQDVGHSGVANQTAKGLICRISAVFCRN